MQRRWRADGGECWPGRRGVRRQRGDDIRLQQQARVKDSDDTDDCHFHFAPRQIRHHREHQCTRPGECVHAGHEAGDRRSCIMSLKQYPTAPRRAAGFSLIELMVAMVVGLIVVGAVLALIVSMIRSNNQTIQATRLTQELRATAMVIASDLKRARGVSDPFAAAKVPITAIDTIDVSTPNCIIYGYQGGAGGDYRVIHLDANNKVVLA